MIDKVDEGLYISGAGAVISDAGLKNLRGLEIDRVLTIAAVPVDETRHVQGVHYHFVRSLDMPEQDLLGTGILEDAVLWVERSIRQHHRVLVHCELGVSRSATVVAAVLMRRYHWPANTAVEFIKKTRPNVLPNNGFMSQLRILQSCGCSFTAALQSAAYRAWAVKTGNSPISGNDPAARHFVHDLDEINKANGASSTHGKTTEVGESSETSTDAAADQQQSSTEPSKSPDRLRLRCAKCRQVLCYQEHVIQHTTADDRRVCRFGHLVQPMKWMQLDDHQAKIACPKCGDKLGHYVWSGRRCAGEPGTPCNRQITPWVHLQRGKVDECTPSSRPLHSVTAARQRSVENDDATISMELHDRLDSATESAISGHDVPSLVIS